MHGKSFLSIFDWRKVGDYFLPKTKSSLQHFLSEYGKTSLELTELKVNQVTLDLAHYEKALVDQAPIAKAKELLQSFRVKEMPIQEYLKLVDESDKRAKEILIPIAQAAKQELITFKEVVNNIETSRDFLELETKDIELIFKENKDRALDLHMMGYDTLPEFRKKYGDFNIT